MIQGGSVVNSLLRQGTAVRAVTRNPESSKAKALVERGVEVVQGDFTDKASLVEVPPPPGPAPLSLQPIHLSGPCIGGVSAGAPICH